MEGRQWINPHKADAVTASTVEQGDHLIVWSPGIAGSREEITILSSVCWDNDGTMVVDAIVGGHRGQYPTSRLGLTGDRYTGEWNHIAILNEEF